MHQHHLTGAPVGSFLFATIVPVGIGLGGRSLEMRHPEVGF
jgi:hypothetical protein